MVELFLLSTSALLLNSMEKHQYTLKLTLKQIVLRKVAIVLWSGTDIINLIKQFRYETAIDEFQTEEWYFLVEKKVKEKVSLFVLPQAIRKDLIYAIKPIGPEILKWKMCHQPLLPDVEDALDHLCWTSVGTVDYRETAKALIKQERINIVKRYHLACVYCLVDDIPLLWGNLSIRIKMCLYDEFSLHVFQAELAILWTRTMNEQETVPNRIINLSPSYFHKYAFLCAAQSGNIAATKFFFQRLTSEERTNYLQKATQSLMERVRSLCNISLDFPKGKFCDVLCFLLSQMDQEQQMEVFKKNAYTCLCCFLNWPWQDLFMKVAELSWAYLSKEKYLSLIAILASGVSISGCYFPELFGEIFLHAPSDFREYIMDQHWESGHWFRYLFYSNSTIESIKLVIRNVDTSDKQKFIICENGFDLCRKLIEDRKWFLLELFIAECALSEEAKAKLKFHFTIFDFIFREGREKERFFHLINTANVEDCSKKSLEDVQNEEHDEFLKKLKL